MRSDSSPSRLSWRAAVVVVCLAGTTIVCAILAAEVHQANAALEAATSRSLGDYATAAGRVLGTEAIRRSNEFRAKLYGPLMGTVVVEGRAPAVSSFVERADSLYAVEGYAPDPLRGYLRVNVGTRAWLGADAMADTNFAREVMDTIFARSRSGVRSSLIGVSTAPEPIIYSSSSVVDANGNHYMYVITQARSTNFRHAMRETMKTVPLLPPSFTGTAWNMDPARGGTPPQPNDSLIGVRITAADGALLYASPHWYGGPYRGSYRFQTGPGSFTIETVLRPDLKSRLVPETVFTVGKALYIGFGLVGCFLLAISFVAFWGEMSHQTSERARSIQQLTTGLRHELNNALASVMLESQMLAASEEASPGSRYAGAVIAEQAARMRAVLRQLDNADHLPIVNYFRNRSMVNLAENTAGESNSRERSRASS